MPSQAEMYSAEQIDSYLSRISFPVKKYPKSTVAADRVDESFKYLSQLQKCHLSSIPFENLALHYSPAPKISLDKDIVYDKIVRKARGGYCMELNLLFANVLKGLGYEVVQTGARVFGASGELDGWNHQVNLVRIGDTIYAVDVGFGGPGQTRPLPLTTGVISKWGATNAETRLRFQEPSNPMVQGLWFYEHRISESHPWSPIYCFGMTEFLPNDFQVMSFAVSASRASWFTYKVLCMKMLLDEEKDDITGIVVLTDKIVKRRVQDKSEILAECTTEEQRVAALKEHFGIVLSREEQAGIKGTAGELKGEA